MSTKESRWLSDLLDLRNCQYYFMFWPILGSRSWQSDHSISAKFTALSANAVSNQLPKQERSLDFEMWLMFSSAKCFHSSLMPHSWPARGRESLLTLTQTEMPFAAHLRARNCDLSIPILLGLAFLNVSITSCIQRGSSTSLKSQ